MLPFVQKVLDSRKKKYMYQQMEEFKEDIKKQKFTINRKSFFEHASRELNLDPGKLSREFIRLSRAPGRLQFDDYVLYRLFDSPGLDDAAKREFLSDSIHWNIVSQVCNLSWQIVTEDKFLSYAYLDRLGFPTPKTVAVLDPGSRTYGNVPTLRNPEDLRSFLKGTAIFPLFAKPNHGLGSYGAAIIKGVDGNDLHFESADSHSIEESFTRLTKGGAFILQEIVKNHADILAIAPNLATIRVMNFIHDGTLRTPFCLIKLPASSSIADNYWRTGNMLASINPETGRIERAVRGKGLTLETLEAHPETGQPFLGLQIPHWDKVVTMNRQCAFSFDAIKFQSADIAVTPDGPLMVEVNTGGAFDLPQLASGRGFLTPEVREILLSFGLKQFKSL